jgi:hypothetical protein
MRLSRQLSSLLYVVVFASSAFFGRTQTVHAQRQEPLSPTAPTADHPAYPLVVRIDHTAFDSLTASEINQRGRVDKVVLGTHAVGESRTQGAISVLLIPDRDEASFDLKFQGRTHTTTVGANGPALIYSHTDTGFVCTRPISFDPTQGFVAGASTIVANTKLAYDGFGSSRGGLSRRLVSSVAERRSGESREQARQIAARDNERELLLAFDKRVNTQLAAMNQKLDIVIYKKLFVGEDPGVQLAARSSKDCIHIGIGKEGSPARLTLIPPRRERAAPIEIWVHTVNLSEPVTKLITLVKDNIALLPTSRLEILRALLIPQAQTDRLIDVAVYDGWIVLGLQNEGTENATTAVKQRSAADVTKSLGRN